MTTNAQQDAGKLGYVSGDDITAALDKLDPAVLAMGDRVAACAAQLSKTDLAAWQRWSDGYAKFSADSRNALGFPWLGYPAIGDEIIAYEDELVEWQKYLAAAGCNVGPRFVTHEEGSGTSTATILELLIGLGLVVAGGYVIVTQLPRRRS